MSSLPIRWVNGRYPLKVTRIHYNNVSRNWTLLKHPSLFFSCAVHNFEVNFDRKMAICWSIFSIATLTFLDTYEIHVCSDKMPGRCSGGSKGTHPMRASLHPLQTNFFLDFNHFCGKFCKIVFGASIWGESWINPLNNIMCVRKWTLLFRKWCSKHTL